MNTSIMQSSGRVTVPADVRRALAMGPGTRLRWEMHGAGAVRVKVVESVAGEVLINHDENHEARGAKIIEAQP